MTKVTLAQVFGTCSQSPEKGNHSAELGIYWGSLFKSDFRSANDLWQEILGAHPNPPSLLHSGHTARLCFPASLLVRCGHVPEFYLKLVCPPSRLGPSKPPTSSFLFSPSGLLEWVDSQGKLRSHPLNAAAPPSAWAPWMTIWPACSLTQSCFMSKK